MMLQKKHNSNWLQIPDQTYRIIIIGGSLSGKTNPLFHLITHQLDIDKFIYMLKSMRSKMSIAN